MPLAKIIENDYSPAAGRSKPVTVAAVDDGTPTDILHEVLRLEDEIAAQGKALLAKMGGGKV